MKIPRKRSCKIQRFPAKKEEFFLDYFDRWLSDYLEHRKGLDHQYDRNALLDAFVKGMSFAKKDTF